SVPKNQGPGEGGDGRGWVLHEEVSAVPQERSIEDVDLRRTEDMDLLHLGLPLGLIAGDIEVGADGIDVGILLSVFVHHADEDRILAADVLVVAADVNKIVGVPQGASLNQDCAWVRCAEASDAGGGDIAATTAGQGLRSLLRNTVKKSKGLLIERHGERQSGHSVQVGNDCGLEGYGGKIYGGGRRNRQIDAFHVEKEECLVLLDGSTD